MIVFFESVWDLLLGSFALGVVAWKCRLGKLRVGTRKRQFALGKAWEPSLRNYRWGMLAWRLPFGHFSSGLFACDFSLESSRLTNLAEGLALGYVKS